MKYLFVLFLVLMGLLPSVARGQDSLFFNPYVDPLARRDESGLLHQSPTLGPTDFAPRAPLRLSYYFASHAALQADPAYVGALQDALRRHGYYCGPTDGVFSDAVRGAIARMQKNFSLRVTGTLTLAVRRGLHLP